MYNVDFDDGTVVLTNLCAKVDKEVVATVGANGVTECSAICDVTTVIVLSANECSDNKTTFMKCKKVFSLVF